MEMANTILKMSEKRALIAATLLAPGCSDIFTQDLEDMGKIPDRSNPPPSAPARAKEVAPPAKARWNKQSVFANAKAAGVCTTAIEFLRWAKQHAPSCRNLPVGVGQKVDLTQAQVDEIGDMLEAFA
jgi:hypothetical protein